MNNDELEQLADRLQDVYYTFNKFLYRLRGTQPLPGEQDRQTEGQPVYPDQLVPGTIPDGVEPETPPPSGGGGTPAGTPTQLQYNADSVSFGGAVNVEYDPALELLNVGDGILSTYIGSYAFNISTADQASGYVSNLNIFAGDNADGYGGGVGINGGEGAGGYLGGSVSIQAGRGLNGLSGGGGVFIQAGQGDGYGGYVSILGGNGANHAYNTAGNVFISGGVGTGAAADGVVIINGNGQEGNLLLTNTNAGNHTIQQSIQAMAPKHSILFSFASDPLSNDGNWGILYMNTNGELVYLGTSGTSTVIAPA